MKFLVAFVVAFMATIFAARAECYGEAEYQVCSDSYVDPNGDIHARSYDTEGNDYSLDTESRQLPGGGNEVTSSDSEGNSYSIKSWSDSAGSHTVDSEGNECTITPLGTMIGCGQ
ncbi:hypothetical protein NKI98_21765 [Mesorhizobium sp. M0222]